MKIGIGSENKAKVAAVKRALQKLAVAFEHPELSAAELCTVRTKTSVPDMPLSSEQMVEGAIERARFTFEQVKNADFAIGLEGGTFPVLTPSLHGSPQFFLQNYVYVWNGHQGFLGSSPALPLPAHVVHALYTQHRELAEVMDTLTGKTDVRSNEGAFGVFTRNLLTRSASFEMAIITAMVPFLHPNY